MKKIIGILKTQGTLITAIILFVSGIAFIATPVSALAVVLRIVGSIILVWEGLYIYAKTRLFIGDRLALSLFICNEAFIIICALVLLISPVGAIKALSFIIGLYLLVTAGMSLFRKLSPEDKPEFGETSITVVSIIFGFWLVLSPFDIVRLTSICIGVALLLLGINTVWSTISGDGEERHDDVVVDNFEDTTESLEDEINKLR